MVKYSWGNTENIHALFCSRRDLWVTNKSFVYGMLSFVGAIIFLRLCEYLFDMNLYNEMTDSFIFTFLSYIISQWNIVCFRLF